VTVNGHTSRFILDTGAAKTIFDISLRDVLGPPAGSTTLRTSSALVPTETFQCPDAFIGPLNLKAVDTVACVDLQGIGQASGEEFQGIVGMDFLCNYAIEIDFDQGVFRIWHRAPKNWGTHSDAITLGSSENRPAITADLPGCRAEFVLDTGANSSYLNDRLFDALLGEGYLQPSLAHSVAAVGGEIRAAAGYLSQLRVGKFAHERIHIDRDAMSGLGLMYLSRYQLQFDFPNQTLYLREGANFSRPDPIGASGMSVACIGDRKIVHAVDPGGAADRAGIKVGDEIVELEGHSTTDYDMHSLRWLLASTPGREILLAVKRGDHQFATRVVLDSRIRE
jgi:PDZ domain/Aspartyl protease